jgi:hypothetical protein
MHELMYLEENLEGEMCDSEGCHVVMTLKRKVIITESVEKKNIFVT